MTAPNQWETFYDRHAPYYDRGAFTRHTEAEVEFLLSVLKLPPGARVLDVGCGTGRHAIELARRGYRITGVDLSAGMLLQAIGKARAAGVDVEWVHADARTFAVREPMDAVLCLCGSAFAMPGLDDDPAEHDAAVLRAIGAALKPGAPLVLTTPNGYRRIREVSDEEVAAGAFDPLTMVQVRDDEFSVGGAEGRMRYKERLYILPELVALLAGHGLAVEHAWGGSAGRWGRRPLEMDEIEVMVVARRVTRQGVRPARIQTTTSSLYSP
jgi:SAM-dependent methyltransferase